MGEDNADGYDSRNSECFERIKQKAWDRGLSVKELCEKIGISRQVFNNWQMRKKPVPASFLYDMSVLLNEPMNYLWNGHIKDDIEGLSIERQRLIHLAMEHPSDEAIGQLFRALRVLLDDNTTIITKKDS